MENNKLKPAGFYVVFNPNNEPIALCLSYDNAVEYLNSKYSNTDYVDPSMAIKEFSFVNDINELKNN